jgi:hypothetical protein
MKPKIRTKIITNIITDVLSRISDSCNIQINKPPEDNKKNQ